MKKASARKESLESTPKSTPSYKISSHKTNHNNYIHTLQATILQAKALNSQVRVHWRRIFVKESRTLFLARFVFGLSYALGFCAWLYVFVCVSMAFTQDSSVIAQILSTLLLSVLVLLSFSVWLLVPRAIIGYFGFCAGVLLFYWIGLSFRFSVAPFLSGFVCVGVGLVYAVLFYLGLYFTHKVYRIFSLFVLGTIAPFSFDWFVPQSWLAYSVFSVNNIAFVGIMCALGLGLCRGRARRARILVSMCVLSVCVDWQAVFAIGRHKQADMQNALLVKDLAIIQSAIPQDLKWEQHTIDSVLSSVFDAIDSAIVESKRMIVFPETILPFVLNGQQGQQQVSARLLEKSKDITIVLGAFSEQGTRIHNSTYIFANANEQILHKVILAPFGEKIPLPDFLAKPLYKFFFGIEEGLQSAQNPQNFTAIDRIWRNAICYEGTSRAMYINAPRHLVMISNNAWFYPSIEPFLQRVLLKYYARLQDMIIVHAANYSSSMILYPLIDDIRATRILSYKE